MTIFEKYYFDKTTCSIHKAHPFDRVEKERFMKAAMGQVDFQETVLVTILCKQCGSENVIKWGKKHGTQRYLCKDCNHTFVANNALPGMRFPPYQIAAALNMYYEGLSLNAIRRHLQHEHDILPSDATVYDWVVRFTKQAVEALEGLKTATGDVWAVDETVLKLDGRNSWFWDVIDDDTRYLVASHLSPSRTVGDTLAVLRNGERAVLYPPRFIVSDGLRSYPDAVDRVFGSDTKHVVSKGFTSPVNTNLIERFHGTLKQRIKVMRGMQSMETAQLVLNGWLIHYNFFRPHESLENKTPGSAAKGGIPLIVGMRL